MRTFTPKVMVISNNESTRFFLEFFLSERGYQVNFNRSWAHHVANTSWELPDLFILEHEGGEECPTACEYLAATDTRGRRKRDVPVLVLAPKALASDIDSLLESGADDVVLIPFQNQQLLMRINSLLYPAPQSRRQEIPVQIAAQLYLH